MPGSDPAAPGGALARLRLLRQVALSLGAVLVVYLTGVTLFVMPGLTSAKVVTAVAAGLLFAIALFTRSAGDYRMAAVTLVATAVLAAFGGAITNGGVQGYVAPMLVVGPLVAALFLGARAAFVTTLAVLGAIVALWGLEAMGLVSATAYSPEATMIGAALLLVVATTIAATAAISFAHESERNIAHLLAKQEQLEAAKTLAEAASRSKSAFLANMSHEIRTPLNGVIGLADVLERSELSPAQREMVGLIRASGETLDRLLSDVLDMSKIEAGRLELRIEPYDLRETVESALYMFRARAAEKGIGLEVMYGAGAEGLFAGDVIRVRQILTNLVSNAVKFTAAGGVTVRVEVREEPQASTALCITVSDSGIGFNAETAKRLFGRFEQADSSISRSFGGNGLGLSICRALTDMMGGEISAQSTPGVGSVFTVVLPAPRAAAAAAAPEAPAAVAVVGRAPLRILVAEDHPTNRRVVSLILEPLGAQLTMAVNGREAVEAFTVARFDLVLMDMQMPDMDGLAATAAIRALEAERGMARTPIAMLSANAMPDHVEMATQAGCDLHIAKPVRPETLLAGIDQALALSAARLAAAA